jgi:DNA-binding XRE family transcriptional regulator
VPSLILAIKIARVFGKTVDDVFQLPSLILAIKIARVFGKTVDDVFQLPDDRNVE